ncbi:hypothetical protein FA95DRAFT_1609153 [Auriscalpium vulgare]|uniref:Uncharacterized protein n=1 Tax=Auriscalpium vulgare TaxID=40419 RepID=A0ACB8RIE7_9AGAM|nr:hypothetical protein FA95DRAFT_1609153 [Auriscalpium vulgare]
MSLPRVPYTSQYSTLPQDDSDKRESLDEERDALNLPPTSHKRLGFIAHWPTALLIACTLLDALAVLYLGVVLSRPEFATARLPALKVKSPYINFDKIYGNGTRPTTRYAPIPNRARAIGWVSTAKPREVLRDDREYLTNVNGNVPPGGMRISVTPQVSTVVQFRAIDYGMENCTVVVDFPPAPPALTLDVWRLDAPARLDMRSLTYSSRPRRAELVGSVTRHASASLAERHLGGKTVLPPFDCPSGSYHTFEMACAAGSDCDLDFVMSGADDDELEIYMLQHQTI